MNEKLMVCEGAETCLTPTCFHKRKHHKNESCKRYCSTGCSHFQCKPTHKPMNRNGANS